MATSTLSLPAAYVSGRVNAGATLIRGVLLPAAMKLRGDWNWYLPRWLEWLPRTQVEPELRKEIPETPPVPAP